MRLQSRAIISLCNTMSIARIIPANYSNTKALGNVLYTHYVYPFEIAGVLLLVAIVAAISLDLSRQTKSKAQRISEQIAVQSKDDRYYVLMR